MLGPGSTKPWGFDPFQPAVQQHLPLWHKALRRHSPVYHVADRDLWFVTSRRLVVEALDRPSVFSSRFGQPQSSPSHSAAGKVAAIQARGWPRVSTILTEDPPTHNLYRRLVARAFGPTSIRQLEPSIRELSAELVETMVSSPGADFVQEFAVPLPLRVIARILGVPHDRLGDLKRWSDELALTIGAEVDDQRHVHQAEQVLEFQRYFANQLEQRRSAPGRDLLSTLATARVSVDGANESPVTTAASLSVIRQLLVAGNETTAKLLSSAVFLLSRHPRHWAWFRADPAGRAGAVVEEALRHTAPAQAMFRVLTRPATLGGVELPEGARVVLCYGSANRDDEMFDDPDVFDPRREHLGDHLAFGHGVHYCLGAVLARTEASTALQEIARRVESCMITADNDFRYNPSFVLRGLNTLRVHFVPDRSPQLNPQASWPV